MVPAILGRKVGMTQIFDPTGARIPVTLIEAGPCVILQVKSTNSKDKYHAVQLGFDDVKPHRSTM
ncbi:MAG: 50S ribosomal protein L3, partial [Phycisphaerae bacterium]